MSYKAKARFFQGRAYEIGDEVPKEIAENNLDLCEKAEAEEAPKAEKPKEEKKAKAEEKAGKSVEEKAEDKSLDKADAKTK